MSTKTETAVRAPEAAARGVETVASPYNRNRFDATLRAQQLGELRRGRIEILQINVGKLCNQTCVHCHVNAGPGRKEVMTRATIDRVVDWLAATDIPTVDITGGAPEIIPDFRYLVERVKALPLNRRADGGASSREPIREDTTGSREPLGWARGLGREPVERLAPPAARHVMDRCNLTIFFEPGHEDLPEFLAQHEIEVIASLPCYSAKNVDAQRGDGVFAKSIRALQRLNDLGYGTAPHLPLQLVYNPVGPYLPGPQPELEADYQRELKERFGIVFNRLYTMTNMPIARFAAWLRQNGEYDRYQELLVANFHPAAVAGLMCRNTLSVGWRGEVYDCDFNQMLELQWSSPDAAAGLSLWDLDPAILDGRAIVTGEHCFGCTAGAGSSCGGAILKSPCPSPS